MAEGTSSQLEYGPGSRDRHRTENMKWYYAQQSKQPWHGMKQLHFGDELEQEVSEVTCHDRSYDDSPRPYQHKPRNRHVKLEVSNNLNISDSELYRDSQPEMIHDGETNDLAVKTQWSDSVGQDGQDTEIFPTGSVLKTDADNIHKEIQPIIDDNNMHKETQCRHQCSFCNEHFASEGGKASHELGVHSGEKPYSCKVCNEAFVSMEEVKHHKSVHTKQFLCSFCGKQFRAKCDRLQHENYCHKGITYPCSFCDKRFYSQRYKKDHEKVHTGTSQYKCSFCGVFSISKSALLVHENVHKKERLFQCTVCGKCLGSKLAVAQHEKRHVDVRAKYKCSICDKIFLDSRSLYRHEKRHAGSMKYECRYCGKKFDAPSILANHERTHTGEKPFKCQFCDKYFSNKDKVVVHERRHKGERNHACSYCGKTFFESTKKTEHERIHTGEKPYKCQMCDYRCAIHGNLTKHMKAHK